MKGYGKNYWAQRAKQYNQTNWVKNETLLEAYLSLIQDYDNLEQVLEVGIGTGVVAKEMVERVPCVTGIDISKEMVDAISHPSIDASIGDAHNLPFEDQIFDLIYMRNVIHYLDDPEKAINEIYRCLKKGGFFLFSQVVPFEDDISDEYDWLIDRNIHYPTQSEILDWFKQFEVLNTKQYILNSQSIMNWLNNTCKDESTRTEVIKRHESTSDRYKTLVNYLSQDGDILVDIKHFMVLGNK